MKDLGSRSLTAVFWGGGGAALRILLQLVVQVALARILGPEQYGLFAIGAIVISFSNFFADVGIAYGLIQKKEVNDNDLRFVATWQLIIGTLVTLAITIASQPIASFFGDIRAGAIVKALAGVCLLNALASPSLNLLKRQLDFKRIQFAQVIAYIVGYICVGVPLAMIGLQVWALVIAWLVQSVAMLAILYGYVRHPLKPLFWYLDARSVSQYGATILLTNMTNWFINNIDRVIVGRVFSSRDVGFYATSYNILYNPTSSLLGVVQPVFFAATARASDETARIAKGYKSLIACVTLFLLPAFAGVAAVSDTFVLTVYGPAWQPLGAIFMPIALAMPVFLLWGLTTPLLWNCGEAGREFKSQLPLVIIWASAAWFAAKISPAAVAWSVLFLFLLRYAIMLGAAIRLLNLNITALWFAVRGGLALSFICALVLTGIDIFTKNYGVPPLPRLILEIISGIVTFLLSLRFIPGLIGSDAAALIGKVVERSPAFVRKYLRSLSGMSMNNKNDHF